MHCQYRADDAEHRHGNSASPKQTPVSDAALCDHDAPKRRADFCPFVADMRKSAQLSPALPLMLYCHRALNVNIIAFWEKMLSMIEGLLLPIAVGPTMINLAKAPSVPVFIMIVVIFSGICFASMLLFAMNREEKALCLGWIQKMIHERLTK